MGSKRYRYECMGIMPAAGAKLRGASNLLFLFVWFTVFPLLLNFGVAKMVVFYTSRWTGLKNRTHEKVSWRTIVSHNRSTEKSVARRTRTNAPPGSLWPERLAQTPHREVCGVKNSHNRPNGKFLERKTRAIAPTRWFWSEKLAQSAATEVFRPVVRRRQSAILWVIHSLRLSDQKRLDEGQPSAFARRLFR